MSIVKEGATKDGIAYTIRHPEMGDVESAWRYINRLSKERTFVSFQGEEISLENEEKFVAGKIEDIKNQAGTALFLIVDGEVQGICGVEKRLRSDSHTAILGLSLDASVRGKGLGRLLMEEVLHEASTVQGLRTIILTVKAPNNLAVSLYKKLGFEEYGRLPNGTSHRDVFVDEIYMFKNVDALQDTE